MEEMRKQLDTFRDTGTWSREVGIRIHRNNSRTWQSLQSRGCFARLRQAIPARRDEHDLWRASRDCIPRDSVRIATGLSESIESSGECDHLRNPVSGTEERIGPLEKSDST